MKALVWGASCLAIVILVSCSEESGRSSSSSGNVSIVLKSSNLRDSDSVSHKRPGTNCSVTYESTNYSGKCYTPVAVSGVFNQVNLSSNTGSSTVRVLGGGSESGLKSVFKKASFDMKTPPTLASSEDNIEGGGGTYHIASLNAQLLKTVFVADTGNQYYHVLIPFSTTPPSSNSTFSSCGLGGGISEADTYGTLISGVTAQTGDILVCIKSSSSGTCADSDYQWVDSSGTLYSTRPSTPLRLTGSKLITSDSCTNGGSNPNVTWGYATIHLSFASAISVTAAIDKGKKTYTSGSTTGSALTFTMDTTLNNSLFVPDSALNGDLSTFSQAQVLAKLDRILLKSVYVNNYKAGNATESDGMLSATATLTIAD